MAETGSSTGGSQRPPVFTFGSGDVTPNGGLFSAEGTTGRNIKSPSRHFTRGTSPGGDAPSSSRQSSPAIVSNTLVTPATSPAREQPSASSAAFSSPSTPPGNNRLSFSPSPLARRNLDSSPSSSLFDFSPSKIAFSTAAKSSLVFGQAKAGGSANDVGQLAGGIERLQLALQASPDSQRSQEVEALATRETLVANDNNSEATRDNSEEDMANEPDHPFFDPAFQKNLEAGRELGASAADTIRSIPSQLHDEHLKTLLSEARDLSLFQPSASKTIAILGDSGEGKSSLINSLLDMPGIAKTGDLGSACTTVVTEYRQKPAAHSSSASIYIEAEYLSREGIKEMIDEVLWNYRRLYFPVTQSADTSAEEYRKIEAESNEAASILLTVFGHRSDFDEGKLQDLSEGAHDRLLEQLLAWTQDITWPSSATEGQWSGSAETVQECTEMMAPFESERYWPFVKVIRVFVNAAVLKAGVVLVDLPGLHDTNLARVRITQDYLMRCSNIFVVAKIARAVTDASLKESLFQVLKRQLPSEFNSPEDEQEQQPTSIQRRLNVSIVCTKSEDIDLDSAKQQFCGPDKPVSAVRVGELERDIERAKEHKNHELKKRFKQQRETLFIRARNDHVRAGLLAAYSSQIPHGDLQVFCVSNKLYKKAAKRHDEALASVSGVPELRALCRLLAADAQFFEAKHFLDTSLINLVTSLQLWTAKLKSGKERGISAEAKEQIRLGLDETRRAALENVTQLVRNAEADFKDIQIMTDRRYPQWVETAHSDAHKWTSWHQSQYNAWCRNNGSHATPKRSFEDWNARIIYKMRMELDFPWNTVEEGFAEGLDEISERVKHFVVSFQNSLQVPEDVSSLLRRGITLKVKALQHNITTLRETVLSDVRLTRRYASETNYKSYILEQMLPAYRQAGVQENTGRKQRQINIIEGRINAELFSNMFLSMQKRHSVTIKTVDTRLRELITNLTAKIRADVDFALANAVPVDTKLTDEVESINTSVSGLMETAKRFQDGASR